MSPTFYIIILFLLILFVSYLHLYPRALVCLFIVWKVLGDVFRTGDFADLVTLREWTRVSGLVDAEQLGYQVQLVEEGQRKHGKN